MTQNIILIELIFMKIFNFETISFFDQTPQKFVDQKKYTYSVAFVSKKIIGFERPNFFFGYTAVVSSKIFD